MSTRQNNRSRHMDRKCKSCGSHDSACRCQFKAPRSKKMKPLASNCTVVNSLVCTKTVQKVAEITLPITAFAGLALLEELVSINVTPDLTAITQNVRVIKDKVVNIGLIPATITVSILDIDLPVSITTSLPFQEHTDCPGACPEDTVTETPLEVEGIFIQPGVPVITGPVVGDLVTGILVKVILRTTFTVTRPLIVDQNGNTCDANPNRCDNGSTPPVFVLPAPPSNGLLG